MELKVLDEAARDDVIINDSGLMAEAVDGSGGALSPLSLGGLAGFREAFDHFEDASVASNAYGAPSAVSLAEGQARDVEALAASPQREVEDCARCASSSSASSAGGEDATASCGAEAASARFALDGALANFLASLPLSSCARAASSLDLDGHAVFDAAEHVLGVRCAASVVAVLDARAPGLLPKFITWLSWG